MAAVCFVKHEKNIIKKLSHNFSMMGVQEKELFKTRIMVELDFETICSLRCTKKIENRRPIFS